jgi:uncharacterized membrane protein
MKPTLFRLLSLAALSSAAAHAVTFSPLDLPGSQLAALSADGCVAAGGVSGDKPAGFRWSAARGVEPLEAAITVSALSPRGDHAAGSTFDSMQREVASYWDAAGKAHRLEAMPGLATIGVISQAHAITDGPHIVGSARRNGGARIAFEWTPVGGMRVLAERGHGEARAIAISIDGHLVAGWQSEGEGIGERVQPLRWRDGRLLPTSEAERGTILGASRDAALLLGWSGEQTGVAIHRETKIRRLSTPTSLRPRAGSDDGKLLVGDSGNGDERTAWIWSEAEGFAPLRDWLARHGSPLPPDWHPLALTAVSADGKRLGGWGRRDDDRLDSFVVDLGGSACADTRRARAAQ